MCPLFVGKITMLEIIDGQQRLSVITILISLISRKLRALNYIESADDIVNTYLVSKASIISAKAHLTEKISKSNGRDFFKLKCQSKEDCHPGNAVNLLMTILICSHSILVTSG